MRYNSLSQLQARIIHKNIEIKKEEIISGYYTHYTSTKLKNPYFNKNKMSEQQEQRERQIAYKVRINDLFKGNYIIQEGWDPNYIDLGNLKISRVNIIAAVLDKEVTDTFATLTLDDGTANITVKSFNEDIKKVENINIGDVVLLIGRPREYNEQLFISIEIIKKVNPLWAKVRKLELEKQPEQKIEIKQKTPREKIINVMNSMDNPEGVDISEVLNMANIENGEKIIDELVKEGELYENKPGRIRTTT